MTASGVETDPAAVAMVQVLPLRSACSTRAPQATVQPPARAARRKP